MQQFGQPYGVKRSNHHPGPPCPPGWLGSRPLTKPTSVNCTASVAAAAAAAAGVVVVVVAGITVAATAVLLLTMTAAENERRKQCKQGKRT